MTRLSLEKVLDRVTEVAREIAAPEAERVDREAAWPERSIRALLDHDLGGLVVPEEQGGCGYGLQALARVSEVLGRACASSALCFGMHCVGSAVIGARATPAQAAVYLEPIAAGEHLTTLALSEPGTGSHFWLPETTVDHLREGYRLHGKKTFVTNGGHADSYVVSTVAADPEAPPGMFSCFVVDGLSRGLEWGPPWRGLGMRGNSSRALELRDVDVPADALLGAEGDQIWYLFNVVAPYFLVAMAGTYLGVAAGALESARLHVSERRYSHDGTRLAHNQLLQHRLGSMWAMVERTRQLLWFAADEGDRDGSGALPALAAAKAEVADCAVTVVNEALTLVGGIGYREGSDLERRLRDARAAHVMAPTTDMLRTWTGRSILGENLLAE
jgi:alkylation response protein AidB-like acyl-CoA dehydrogenase